MHWPPRTQSCCTTEVRRVVSLTRRADSTAAYAYGLVVPDGEEQAKAHEREIELYKEILTMPYKVRDDPSVLLCAAN